MGNKAILFLGQLFVLNTIFILTVVFSLGILIGPATSALFHVSKLMSDRKLDEYGLVKIFMKTIKTKFKYGLMYSIVAGAAFYMVSINLDNINYLKTIYPTTLLIILQYYILIEVILISLTALYLNGNYEFKRFIDLIRMAFYLSNKHILSTLFMVTSVALFSYVVIYFINMTLLFFCFSLLSIWICLLWKPVVKRYEYL
jgi:hypothetical protein